MSKDPSRMNLEEVQEAYDHAVRNLSAHQIAEIQRDPIERPNDGVKILLCKTLYRRLLHLESTTH